MCLFNNLITRRKTAVFVTERFRKFPLFYQLVRFTTLLTSRVERKVKDDSCLFQPIKTRHYYSTLNIEELIEWSM